MDPVFIKTLVFTLVLWTLPLKVYALALSLKRHNEKWFVVFIVFNTLGILEIIYLFGVAKKKLSEFRKDFSKPLSAIH
jgi:hypothetical protein